MVRFLQGWRRGPILLVLLLGVISMTLWRVPWVGLLFYPFHLFATFVHELCHGVTAIMTGGDFQRFAVHPDLSGVAWSVGGIGWLIVSAGYVGSALFGGLLVILAVRGVSANYVLVGMGIVLGILCLVFVRNLFGIVSGLVLAWLLTLAGNRLPTHWAGMLLLFLAVQMMLNALDSLLNLVWISTYGVGVPTDAFIMQQLTGIPAFIWALVWSGISLVVLIGALVLAYRTRPTF